MKFLYETKGSSPSKKSPKKRASLVDLSNAEGKESPIGSPLKRPKREIGAKEAKGGGAKVTEGAKESSRSSSVDVDAAPPSQKEVRMDSMRQRSDNDAAGGVIKRYLNISANANLFATRFARCSLSRVSLTCSPTATRPLPRLSS